MEPLVQIILDSIIFVLPLWFGNAAPTILGGGKPIDGGKFWRDGKRVLGDGKTIRGFWAGSFVGGIVGALLGLVNLFYSLSFLSLVKSSLLYEFFSSLSLQNIFSNSLIIGFSSGFIMTFGGLVGDLIGSFIKRRSGIERGHPFIFLDQLGFLVLGMIFVFPLVPWPVEWFLVLVPITFITHIAANLLGYFTGIQDAPL